MGVKVLTTLQKIAERPDFFEQLKALGIDMGKRTEKIERVSIIPDNLGNNMAVSAKDYEGLSKIFVILSTGTQEAALAHHQGELQKRALQPGFEVLHTSQSVIHNPERRSCTYTLYTLVRVNFTHASAF